MDLGQTVAKRNAIMTRGRQTRKRATRTILAKDFDWLLFLMGGHIFFQTLSAAVQLDLFTLLSRRPRLTRAQIAQSLGLQEKPTRILLLGCTTLGLLKKVGERYTNSPIAEKLLSRTKPENILSVVEWQHYINYRPMYRFCDALKANHNVGLEEYVGEGTTLYERLAKRPDLEIIFQAAMEVISRQANQILAKFIDLSRVRCLLDVGGGNAANIIALAKKYPRLHATVFDSSSVCRIAEGNIQAVNLGDRLSTISGNCFMDEFPRGFDCILFAHFFTIWSEEKDRVLLKKSYRVLPHGGRVIIFNMMQSDREDGPLNAAWGSPYFLTLATGEGMLYTWKEYEAWMKDAGFTTVRRQVLPVSHGAIIGIKR